MNTKLNEYKRKKIVKGISLSILLFVVATIWCHIIAATTLLSDPYRNVFLDFIVIILPFIIIPLLFVREKDFRDSFIFGAVIGFVGGTLFLIYWMAVPIITAPDPNADYSLAPMVWIIFIMLFTGSSVAGSMLSYLIRKTVNKKKKSQKIK